LNSKLSKKKFKREAFNDQTMLSLVHGDVFPTLNPKQLTHQTTQTSSSSSLMGTSRYQKKFETLKKKLDQISSEEGSETETIQGKEAKARVKLFGNYYRPLRKKSKNSKEDVVLLGTPQMLSNANPTLVSYDSDLSIDLGEVKGNYLVNKSNLK
jgi:hypothetical protein